MCQVCEHYIALGGVIHVYPFGHSGLARERAELALRDRKLSVCGWFKRFGGHAVPEDALPLIVSLRLPIYLARVELVWTAARDREPVRITTIAQRVGVRVEAATKTANVLIEAHRMQRSSFARGTRYQALGDTPPHWREFLGKAA